MKKIWKNFWGQSWCKLKHSMPNGLLEWIRVNSLFTHHNRLIKMIDLDAAITCPQCGFAKQKKMPPGA